MKSGRVVEQGFRCDLEKEAEPFDSSSFGADGTGEFRKMLDVQLGTGGFLPTKDLDAANEPVHVDLDDGATRKEDDRYSKHQTLLRPLTFGNWMFDVVADLTSAHATAVPVTPRNPNDQASQFVPPPETHLPRQQRPSSLHIAIPPLPLPIHSVERTRLSLQFTPISPVFSTYPRGSSPLHAQATEDAEDDREFEDEKNAMKRSATLATSRRPPQPVRRQNHAKLEIKTDGRKGPVEESPSTPVDPQQSYTPPSFWITIVRAYSTVPHKPILFLGLLICLLSGAMTPLFSFLLSRLLFEVSTGAHNTTLINRFGGIVLGVAGLDGLLLGLKYFLMESAGMAWVTSLRKRALSLVLRQDKAWFDSPDNSSVRLVQVLVKDGDDARNLIAVVMGQCVVVASMLAVGLLWALVRGWQLTFVGFAIAPVFVGVMGLQTRLVAGCEMRNKKAREEVSRWYYDVSSWMLFFCGVGDAHR
jgi:ATP-binding cassette subfamily B (MDR/TAP) protein 1